jgi:hypothetical protein
MLKLIGRELWHHIPFTGIGAVSGIIAMVIISRLNVSSSVSEALFYTFHPLHILLSAIVTTALYRKYKNSPFWITIPICYLGPIIVGTLSDAIIPYVEGSTINVAISFELPFISSSVMPYIGIPEWIVVNGAALIGIAIGYFQPKTRFPHLWHILLSTWASLLYFSTFGTVEWISRLPLLFVFLFIAVWIPCVFSDVVFPILWTGKVHDHDHNHDHDNDHDDDHDHTREHN